MKETFCAILHFAKDYGCTLLRLNQVVDLACLVCTVQIKVVSRWAFCSYLVEKL